MRWRQGSTRHQGAESRGRRCAKRAACLGSVFAAVAAVGVTAASAQEACPSGWVGCQLSYTGGVQTVTVPSGVHEIEMSAYGASGPRGPWDGYEEAPRGGIGGRESAGFRVEPGETLKVIVGGCNGNCTAPFHNVNGSTVGGFGGGGAGGAGDHLRIPVGSPERAVAGAHLYTKARGTS